MVKKGDTLIEVTLAIGIFSMVAIAVVAVMVSGTSNAQTALETTLAREEIDTQAEALRFIHAAYLADEDTGENKDPYTLLWKEIVNNAYKPTNTDADADFLQYAPASCNEIYSNPSGPLSKAFIINPRALSNLTTSNTSNAYFKYSSNVSKFKATSTYPRLVFTTNQANNKDALIDNPSDTMSSIQYAEGLYVLAVVDPKSTNIVGTGNTSAYFDFYIRTCWYGMGSETPSTISTVIRLYDPEGLPDDAVDSGGGSVVHNKVTITFNPNGGGGTIYTRRIDKGSNADLTNIFSAPSGSTFIGWNTSPDGSGTAYNTSTAPFSESTTLYAQWGIRITYRANGGIGDDYGETVRPNVNFNLRANAFSSSSGGFLGWNTKADGTGASYTDQQVANFSSNTTLYAQWGKTYLQDLTAATCQAQASANDLVAYDRRDDKQYTVRYINGHCWMTKNLDFRTGLDSSWFWWWGTVGGVYRGYYSVYAARDFSICPSRWGLPTQSEANSLSGHMSEFKPEFIGYLQNHIIYSEVVEDGYRAYYWLRSNSYSLTVLRINQGSQGAGGGSNIYSYDGVPVRCILK